jgi:hypothetical protein
MSETTSYARAVEANLAHMGTAMSDWRACANDLAIDADGKVCVSSVLPDGYAAAPSMYRNTASGDACCELCGHKIRHLYYCQNDAKRWTLIVGSECVKAFVGVDGATLADDAERALALETLAWLVDTHAALRGQGMLALWYASRDAGAAARACDNVSIDPLAWMRRNRKRILRAVRSWVRAVGVPWMGNGPRVMPRPPEAWLPENRA